MGEPHKIIWSEEASGSLDDIHNYLKKHWTEKELSAFFQKLEKAILLISVNPKTFPVTSIRTNLRRCVLSKQLSLYYVAGNKTVFITSLFDNRQDPKKI